MLVLELGGGGDQGCCSESDQIQRGLRGRRGWAGPLPCPWLEHSGEWGRKAVAAGGSWSRNVPATGRSWPGAGVRVGEGAVSHLVVGAWPGLLCKPRRVKVLSACPGLLVTPALVLPACLRPARKTRIFVQDIC